MARTSNTITPARVKFSLASTETPITDAQLTLTFSNGSRYTECVLAPFGTKGYLLTKGAEITREGALKVQTTRTGDRKGDAAIDNIRNAQNDTHKSDDPADYTKDITFVVQTPGETDFLSINFSGFVKEYQEFDPEGTAPPMQEAEIDLYDPLSLEIKALP
ncbi:MAG: hypothetical protein AAFP00_17320 [Bacteroidota bacterium]